MKRNTFKILCISLTLFLASCMPDSMTKFKEDPPKKQETVTTGGTVAVPDPDLYVGNGVICNNGNGKDTTEGTAQDLVVAADIAAPFDGVADFNVSPYTEGNKTGVGSVLLFDDPNYEFNILGDGVEELTSLSGGLGVECHFADDSTTTDFDNADLGAKLTWSISPDLPTGLTEETTDGVYTIKGKVDGFNEMAIYTITATNGETGVAETDQIEIASSTPLIGSDGESVAYYTQMNGTNWAMKVDNAGSFIPNYVVVNEKGAYATINFIDRENQVLYLTIGTTSGEEHTKYFSFEDNIDMALPASVATPSYSQALSKVDDLYATLLTDTSPATPLTGDLLQGTSFAAGLNNNSALHFKEDSGFVLTDTNGTYDGLTPDDTELTEWIRCKHSPDISGLGTIQFLDGVTSSFTNISEVTNWGVINTDLVNGDNEYQTDGTTDLDRNCEFTGEFTTPFNYKKITTTIYNFAGQSTTATLGLQARADIAQPYPVTNKMVEDVDREFYFHYRYKGTQAAKMILSVSNSSTFDYKSTVLDENMISNARGTKATVTAISGNQIFVTLENNDSYAFVVGDEVDNTASFLGSEATITGIEYNFAVGFDPAGDDSYFEPQLAMKKAADRLNVDGTGLVITPFGSSEFSAEFLEQVRKNGNLSILNNSGTIESRIINSITLIPGNHSLGVSTLFSADGIQNGINKLAYVQPYGTAELALMSYSIDNYIGQASATACTGPSTCATTDLVLLGSLASRQVSFKPGNAASDPEHGRITIDNVLTSTTNNTQSFTIAAIDVDGNTATTTFNYSISAPPAGISLNRNLLLSVPSGSAFKVGSYVSSNNTKPGLGIVKDILNDDDSTLPYFILDIQLIKGAFEEDDDLDNRQTFDSQKTYIFTNGVIPYNVAVSNLGGSTLDASTFQDRYSCAIPSNRKFILNGFTWDTSATRGMVAYAWDGFGPKTSTLVPATDEKLFLQLERGTLSTSSSLAAIDCSGAIVAGAHSLEEVVADHMIISVLDETGFEAGLNITAREGAVDTGAGVIHQVDTGEIYVGQFYHDSSAGDSVFKASTTPFLDNANPYSASEETATGTITLDHTFYLYRHEEASIQFNLEAGFSDGAVVEFLDYNGAAYCKDCTTTPCTTSTTRTACIADSGTWFLTDAASFPLGLDADSTTGIISGTPLINADKEKFVARVSTPYGTVEHEFEIKVYDHYIVAPTDTITKPKPDSFILHQIGYGMASVPCRVTQEAMDTGNPDVVDLTCVLDAGESDLFYKGINLTIRTGDDMCTAVNHTPYSYYDWPYIKTANASNTLYKNTGAFADPLCFNQPEYSINTTAAFIDGNGGADPALTSAGIDSDVKEMCKSNFSAVGALVPGGDFTAEVPKGPNCNDGTVLYKSVEWTAQDFVCNDGSGNQDSLSTSIAQCSANNGTCADGADADLICLGCGSNDDCVDCANLTECTAAGDDWTPDYSHNDANTALNYSAAIGDWGCSQSPSAVDETAECGGTQGLCISGAALDSTPLKLTTNQLADRATIAHVMTSSTQVDIGYKAPFDVGVSTNFYLTNYMNQTTCDTTDYNFNWDTTGLNNDWLDVADESASGAANPFAGGYNHYQYTCDTGAGIAARVRMLVRDFDNDFTVTDGIEKLTLGAWAAGGAGDLGNLMDDNYDDSTKCAFPICNNRRDWDDVYVGGGTCGDAALNFDFDPGVPVQPFPRELEF